ncbi:hypothetical protein [Phytoactinopolyspora halotolerans]|uniref:Nuclear transport factor 2 family protein n=1 Tax=Phytoactinopolyspora halotolerans TaxID=1981512 RepID=A0A6L9SAZ7_9ACTN|nr:hypothetical protein [Phytoactinopolyspora halotolerans]NEE01170.1 hypothetical protein [Phytoactinopolyspora halotolerans]
MTPRMHLPFALAGIAAVVLAACTSDDDGDPIAEPTETTGEPTTPPLTSPPTPSPEERAAEDIKSVFNELIAAWDDARMNTSDYASENPTWATELVLDWPADMGAQDDLASWLGAWGRSDIEQVGETVIATHEISDVELSDDGEPVSATSRACLDMTELKAVDYDGNPYEPPSEPAQYQSWDMTWNYLPPEPGWTLLEIDLTLNEPCSP